jgi:hypothetical protein
VRRRKSWEVANEQGPRLISPLRRSIVTRSAAVDQAQPWRLLGHRTQTYVGGEDILGGGVFCLETSSFTLSVCAVDVLDAMEARVDSAGS